MSQFITPMTPMEWPSYHNQKAYISLFFGGSEAIALVRDLGHFAGHPDWSVTEDSWFYLIVGIALSCSFQHKVEKDSHKIIVKLWRKMLLSFVFWNNRYEFTCNQSATQIFNFRLLESLAVRFLHCWNNIKCFLYSYCNKFTWKLGT